MDHINDGQTQGGVPWMYSDKVKEHFFNPKHFTTQAPEDYDGCGLVGSPACGDLMKFWIKVRDEKIVDVKWQTFGCASAIASTSALAEMLLENGGTMIEEALKIKPQDIMERLGGLPDI
ncbi:MAG: hypothetical protein COU22_01605, partial [Candidatus Komeilibacteria bacterium CG10_big_fil_rev_8_21_14_0_10_41_13]